MVEITRCAVDHSDANRCYARGHYFRYKCCFPYDHGLTMGEKPCRCDGHGAWYASMADSDEEYDCDDSEVSEKPKNGLNGDISI